MAKACGECKAFDFTKGKAGLCSWGIKECKDQWSTHAKWCPLFTEPSGYMPLLDCEEEDLPEWTKTEQQSLLS